MGDVYATSDQLGKLALNPTLVASFSADEVTEALTSASALADTYIGTRFDLPLQTYGRDITLAVCRIAAYLLLQQRGFNPGTTEADTFRKNYEAAEKWLIMVAQGKATPAFPDTEDAQGFDPDQMAFTLQPAQGSIGVSSGSFAGRSDDDSSDVEVGTVGPPRSRGW